MPPVGFKRSRALWDQARRPHATRRAAWLSFGRAVAYECQPVRVRQWQFNHTNNQLLQQGWRQICETVPQIVQMLVNFVSTLTIRQWWWTGGALMYYMAVRWLHHALDAGPIVLIVTAMIAIFTIGLGDNENNDGLSAYSVFNRGFQRLLGTVEAEDLVAQQMGMARHVPRNDPENNNRRVRRDPPLRPAAVAAAVPVDDADEDNENENEAPEDQAPDINNNNNRARLSRKKARGRRNLEQREEIRRQREAARAMGFGEDDQAALQRLE